LGVRRSAFVFIRIPSFQCQLAADYANAADRREFNRR
jgi:hypothetical protein